MRRTIARARPTSAAAMVITKMAKMRPVNWSGERYTAKAMKFTLTACSISSTDMRMRTALRRARTPYIPREKRMVLSTRKPLIGIIRPPLHPQQPGTWNMEQDRPSSPCSWFLVPCSWFLVPCSWFLVPCSWPSFPLLAAGQDDGPHQGHQEHQGGYLKRESPCPEQGLPQVPEGHDGDARRLARPR